MIGRSAELETIVGHVNAVCALAHSRNVVFVTGEAGMGKTTLLHAVEARLAGRTGPDAPLVVSTECSTPLLGQDVGKVEALEPWAELLERILRHDATRTDPKEMLQLLGRVAVAWTSHCVPVLGGVIGASIETAMLMKEHSENKKAASQEQLFQQYVNFLAHASDAHPLVLILDDFHWADTSSTNLLFAAARHLLPKRVAFVIAYRPDDAASSRGGEGHPLLHVKNELGRYSLFVEVALAGMSTADISLLLRARYASYRENHRFARWLAERSDGNALFITQYLHTLEEDGIVNAATGEPKAHFDAVAAPSSASSVVEERIRRLDDESRELLRYASVEGTTFTVTVLSALAEVPRLKLMSKLRLIAEKHGVIRSAGRQRIYASESTCFHFGNVLMQRALYQSLEEEEREALHARVFASIKADWAASSDASSSMVGLAVRLAAHATSTEDRHVAAPLLLEAARASWSRCADEETLSVLLALAEDLEGLEAARLLGQDVGERELKELEGEAALLEGKLHKFRGRHSTAIDRFRKARAIFEALDTHEARALESMMREAFTFENAHRYREAEAISRETLARALKANDVRVQGAMHNNLGLALTGLGRLEEGLEEQRKSLALREASGDRVGQAVVLGSMGLALFSQGRIDEALEHHQRALALREELGDAVGQGYSLYNIGNILAASDRPEEALFHHKRSAEVRESCGDILGQAKSLESEAMMQLWLGRTPEAIAGLDKVLRLREMLDDRGAEAEAAARLGRFVVEHGETGRGRSLLERALMLAEEEGNDALIKEVRERILQLPPVSPGEQRPEAGAPAGASAASGRPSGTNGRGATSPARSEPDLPLFVQAAMWLHDWVEKATLGGSSAGSE